MSVPERNDTTPVIFSMLIHYLFKKKKTFGEKGGDFVSVFDISTANAIHLHQHHCTHIIATEPSVSFCIY